MTRIFTVGIWPAAEVVVELIFSEVISFERLGVGASRILHLEGIR